MKEWDLRPAEDAGVKQSPTQQVPEKQLMPD
jgi:hypothetical protein